MGVLTVSIKEELTLNGAQQGGVNTVSIASVTQSFKRVVQCRHYRGYVPGWH